MNKNKKKYITIKDGNDFRYIAKLMTDNGYEMNHATARNVMLSAIKKFIKSIAKEFNTELSPLQLKHIMNNQEIHDSIHDILIKLNKEGELLPNANAS